MAMIVTQKIEAGAVNVDTIKEIKTPAALLRSISLSFTSVPERKI
jgi:hypothetical protein